MPARLHEAPGYRYSRLMRSLLCAALLLLTTTTAFAEDRSMVANIGATFGAIDGMDADPAEGLFGPRITLAWERAPLEMPAMPGYNVKGALVPELTGGAFINDVSARAFLGVGLRAELKMAQREQGLLKVSARGGFYLAGRALAVGDERQPMFEFAIGEYFTGLHSWTRVGFELAVVSARRFAAVDTMEGRDWGVGGVAQFFVGFAP